MLSRVRQFGLLVWLALVVLGSGLYVTNPELFRAERIAEQLRQYAGFVLILYLLASITRAVFLIPSTPFVLAGGLLMPHQPGAVLVISMTGILLSATLLYYLPTLFGISDYVERRFEKSLTRMRDLLAGRWGVTLLFLWSAFPFTPTDAACYVAGSLRIPFRKYLTAVCLGEFVICSIYVYVGTSFGRLMQTGNVIPNVPAR
ncbi:MAG: TVP38/TMEM64 family protein [Planctomycetes bacterium]|nr:TVP38/TMEM64 family protein [Planctomycetota bacterium]